MGLVQVQLFLYPFVPLENPGSHTVKNKKKPLRTPGVFRGFIGEQACSYLDFTVLINLAFLLSALEFCSDTTAHIAAGIHPISVI